MLASTGQRTRSSMKKISFKYRDLGAHRWRVETLGFCRDATPACEDLLRKRWDDELVDAREGDQEQEVWYARQLARIREAASVGLRQSFDPRATASEEHINESTAVEIFSIKDHFNCEGGLNRGGDYTYVRVFAPDDELARLRGSLARLDQMTRVSNRQGLAVSARWLLDLKLLESYVEFLHKSGVRLGVQLLTADC